MPEGWILLKNFRLSSLNNKAVKNCRNQNSCAGYTRLAMTYCKANRYSLSPVHIISFMVRYYSDYEAESGACSNGKNLAALVKAAGRAGAVRQAGFAALRTLAQLGQREDTVIGAAHALAAFRRLSLRYTHIK